MINILLPSRGRAELLHFSLNSMGINEHNLEALIWIDEDDAQLPHYHKLFDKNDRVKLYVKPRVGYRNYHLMLNFLALQAKRDWFWLWNDDCYMDNHDWYGRFAEHASLVDPKNEPVVFNLWGPGTNSNAFPIVSRKYFDLLGYLAPTAFCDLYVKNVAIYAKIHRSIFGININHRNYGHDNKMGDVVDDTKREIDKVKQKSKWLGLLTNSMRQRKNDDAAKIRGLTQKRHAGFVGLGKLGLPVALAMEARGNRMVVHDANPKIKSYLDKQNQVPNAEALLENLLNIHSLEWVDSIDKVVEKTDLIFCAVQTPHEPKFEGNKTLPKKRSDFDYSFLKKAVKAIVASAEKRDKKITLVVISTCLPGTYKDKIKPLLTSKVNYIYNPYFIAMGTVIDDFYNPELVLIGKDGGDVTPLTNFYKLTLGDKETVITDITTAEGIKVFYNTYITTKTVLGNMYGELAHKLGMNVDHIYLALSTATNRLISPKYLKSGVADGGACHPRDNIALSYLADKLGLSFNFFNSIITAREKHMAWLAEIFSREISKSNLEGIILGKSFKPETDIQAGSAAMLLANILKQKQVRFRHYEFDYPQKLPRAVYFIATQHPIYQTITYPAGSIIIDPFRYIKKAKEVRVISIGRQT